MKAGFIKAVLSTILLFSSLVSYPFSSRCEAAFAPAPVIRVAAAVAGPQTCEAGVMDQLCSSVMNFLDDESAKASAEAKACKTSCRWKKRKGELLEGARKKAKESCAKGEAPDLNAINKGLDGNAKARLKSLYDNNSRMFDGTAKLADVNFAPASSKDAALTGKGGKVTDLKSAEPATPKLNAASEFGLSGTKLSGGTYTKSAAKQPATVLAAMQSPVAPQKASAAGKTAAANETDGDIDMSGIEDIEIPKLNLDDPVNCAKLREDIEAVVEKRKQIVTDMEKLSHTCDGFIGTDPASAAAAAKCREIMNSGLEQAREGLNKADDYLNISKEAWEKSCSEPVECGRIRYRIDEIKGLITIYTANPNYGSASNSNNSGVKDGLASSIDSAETTCYPWGPKTDFKPLFYTLDPELQVAVIAHEKVHERQCQPLFKIFGWGVYYKWDRELRKKGWPGPFEIPALEAEKGILEAAAKELGCRPQ